MPSAVRNATEYEDRQGLSNKEWRRSVYRVIGRHRQIPSVITDVDSLPLLPADQQNCKSPSPRKDPRFCVPHFILYGYCFRNIIAVWHRLRPFYYSIVFNSTCAWRSLPRFAECCQSCKCPKVDEFSHSTAMDDNGNCTISRNSIICYSLTTLNVI
jgi:hypothetical protein